MRYLAVCLALLSACGVLSPGGDTFPEHRVYVHDFFESQEACDEWRAEAGETGWEMSCSELVRFCPDGQADWLVGGGDIMRRGSYAVQGRRIVVSDRDTTLQFWILADGDELHRPATGTTWHRAEAEEAGFEADGCPSG